ncbi:TylF/MycF/NovP-related O-methyltransferase [Brachyspira hampsonii]|uniref:TylF/MycF/NovP-related O-methyltransferase n=1 Tax=Brachyspira hampsonii TaxID=1287055 RepID=UPI0015E6CFD9|nr:TylF/MycF/NovP-related O-methyltransferase [Brachyspira hampsonii]
MPESSGYWPENAFTLNGNLPKVNDNVSLIQGYFDKTLPIFLNEHKENIAFIHIDSDLYSSAKTIFDNVYDRIESGTIIQFDEYYNYPGWKHHEYKAFKEFADKYNVEYEYIGISILHVAVKINKIQYN